MDKKKVIRSFSRAARTYDSAGAMQREVASELLEYLPKDASPAVVLDAGSGTGVLSEGLADAYPGALVIACDMARDMLVKARETRRCAGTRLVVSDIECLPLRSSGIDLVASSLAYQWAEDVFRAMREAHRVLKEGGHLVFSTLADATLFELRESVAGRGDFSFMGFAGEDVILDSLNKAGFSDIRVEREFKRKTYKDLFALLKTLKSVGASNPHAGGSPTLARGLALREAAGVYAERYPVEGGIIATYEVVFAAARKAGHGAYTGF